MPHAIFSHRPCRACRGHHTLSYAYQSPHLPEYGWVLGYRCPVKDESLEFVVDVAFEQTSSPAPDAVHAVFVRAS